MITLLQKNDGLTEKEAEAKMYAEIEKAEADYLHAAHAVLNHPELGRNPDVRRFVLGIPYGMGGNVSDIVFNNSFLFFDEHGVTRRRGGLKS